MTASPIDAKTDVAQAAEELESLLHCKIATSKDMSLTDAIKKPAEHILRYETLPRQGLETELLRSIKARFPTLVIFEKQFEMAKEVARHLGRWCADLYLTDALSERKLRRYELEAERRYYSTGEQRISELDAKLATIRDAVDFVEREHGQHVAFRQSDFTSKVTQLRSYLGYMFERPSEHRCIVFVEARQTAKLLAAAMRTLGTQHMKCGHLVGAGTVYIEEDNFTFRQQVLTLAKFRKGEINCLFATSVAEEGLDVPDCNLVIRFDMYKTMIQYVQSRGRARKENSRFIHMLETGNSIHQQLLSEVRYQEMAMRRFCEAMPEDRRLTANEDHLEELMAKEKLLRVYTEPSTGAKLTYGNALAYLANFVSAIPSEGDEAMYPTYVVSNQGSKFLAEVLLPGNAPVHSAIGRVCTKKTLAKRSAAFEACIELRKKRYIDEHLMPTYQKKLPAMRNALLAVNMNKTNMYTMRTKPSIWAQTRGSLPTELWVTIIDFPGGLDHPHQPLALLTRTSLMQLPSFPVYLDDGRGSVVASRPLRAALQMGSGRLAKLTAFTFRVFKDVFSKTYEEQAEQLSYWLAPVARSAAGSIEQVIDTLNLHDRPDGSLDWPLLDAVLDNDEYKWTPDTPTDSLVGRFLVDKWDGSRKFYCTAVCPEMRPLDPVPEDAAKAKWNENILEYSISLWKKARERAVWDTNQPVMQAEKFLQRRNLLATPDAKESNLRKKAWLCPEPLRISVLPPAIAASCFVWPAIIHRFESYLIALEASGIIGVDCEPTMALAAMTKDSDNSGDHEHQEQINYQRGMGENYERLEFIGDTFLKTATSISTFIQYPNDNEAQFHETRMMMLCNKNLFSVAQDLKLYEYIRSIAFSRRLWYPEGLKLLEGKGVGKQEETSVIKHQLGEKTIADVCEALIGAAYLTHHKPNAQWQPAHWENAVRAVTKLVGSKNHKMLQWSDYSAAYDKPNYQTREASAAQKDLATKVELEHPYHFNYATLLRSAFTHSSEATMNEKLPSYQRLEFLGDALLDMASISHLFYRFPDKDPQWLTEHKMAMVSNKFLGAVCVNMGFHKHLRHTSSIMQHQISSYAIELQEAKRTAGDARDYWTTVADPPKCLPDVIESFVGAMFIDSNFDYNVVQQFFERNIKWYFEDMGIYDTFANNHPCTHLHNLLQTTYGCQDYRLMARELPSIDTTERKYVVAGVMVHDEIVAHSKGKSGRYARLRAASDALKAIEGLAPFEFRSRFGCSCHLKGDGSSSGATGPGPADCNI